MKSGDNLTKIATQHGISVKALRAANGLKTDSIKVGQKLKIPAKAASAPVTAPAAPAEPAPTSRAVSVADRAAWTVRSFSRRRAYPGVWRSSSQMKVAVTILVFCVAALLALGMVMLYSSSMAQVGAHYLVMQLVGCAIGMALCLMAAAFDYRRLKKFAWPLFALAVVLLVLVFLPHIGIRRNGAARWLGYGKTSLFQPSEFAKLALIIVLAWYGERFQRQMPTLEAGMLIPGLFIGLTVGLDLQRAGCGQHAGAGGCERQCCS